jgi:hypothetical protein
VPDWKAIISSSLKRDRLPSGGGSGGTVGMTSLGNNRVQCQGGGVDFGW